MRAGGRAAVPVFIYCSMVRPGFVFEQAAERITRFAAAFSKRRFQKGPTGC